MAISGTKLNTLVARVVSELNDSTGEMWSSLEVGRWINDAKNYLCQKDDFWFMERSTSLSYLAEAESVDLPDDLKRIGSVKQGTDVFEDFTLLANTLVFDEAPSTAGSLTLKYYAFLADITDSASTFPSRYDSILVDYAVARGKIKEEISADVANMLLSKMIDPKVDLMMIESKGRDGKLPGFSSNANI